MADFSTPSPLTIEENTQTLNMAHLGLLPFTNSGTSLKDWGEKKKESYYTSYYENHFRAFQADMKAELASLAVVGQPIDSSSYFTPTFVGKFSYINLLKAR